MSPTTQARPAPQEPSKANGWRHDRRWNAGDPRPEDVRDLLAMADDDWTESSVMARP